MKPIHTGFIIGFILGIVMFLTNSQAKEAGVLGKSEGGGPTSTPSPVPTLTPAPTVLPTASPSATLTPQPEADRPLDETLTPTTTPTPIEAPSHLKHLFNQYAIHYNVDPQLLIRIAWCESRFDPEAVSGPYVGLFQFHPDRWITYRTQMGHDINPDLRANAEEAIKTAAYIVSLGKLFMWPNCVPDGG